MANSSEWRSGFSSGRPTQLPTAHRPGAHSALVYLLRWIRQRSRLWSSDQQCRRCLLLRQNHLFLTRYQWGLPERIWRRQFRRCLPGENEERRRNRKQGLGNLLRRRQHRCGLCRYCQQRQLHLPCRAYQFFPQYIQTSLPQPGPDQSRW